MLHLLGFPANRNDLFGLLLCTLNDNDEVVLLDEGLQWAGNEAAMAELCNKASVSVHLLGDKPQVAVTGINLITATELVALSEQHPACSSWYS